MTLAECNVITDKSGRELAEHGTTEFPIACYQDDLSLRDVPWHWHQEWEAVRIISGSCVVAAGNQKMTLQAGEGFFLNSGILHGCWDENASGCKFHSLVFHPRLVGGSLDSVFYRRYVQPLLDHPDLEFIPLIPSLPWQKEALAAIEQAWQHRTQETPGFAFRVRSELSTLVFLLHSNMSPSRQSVSAKSIRDGERIKAMLSYIHTHYSSELNTETIAASASISDSECLRCFRSTIGTTPIQYVKRYRIQQAAQMLMETDDKITEIASRCGFQDMSYFTRAFRELKGCVPTQYRKNANP